MNCPKCQLSNAEGARVCIQCGAALGPAVPSASPASTQPASAPPSGSNKTALIVLGVIFGVILLFVVGIYTAFHMVANKVRALASGDTQTSSQGASDSGAQESAQATGNVIGNILGTDAKGKSDIGKAIGNLAQTGKQIEQRDKAGGNTSGTPLLLRVDFDAGHTSIDATHAQSDRNSAEMIAFALWQTGGPAFRPK